MVLLLFIPVSFSQTSGKCAFTSSDNTRHYPDKQGDNINRTVDCDTLRYPLSGEIIYYYMLPPGVGYITGNNSYMDKADRIFSDFEAGTSISGLFVDFVIAKMQTILRLPCHLEQCRGQRKTGTDGCVSNQTSRRPLQLMLPMNTPQKLISISLIPIAGPFYAGVNAPFLNRRYPGYMVS
ncbi:MAG: hypothetical protein IPN08_09990 [Bacteroidales bacterium]|nr:hypothetical protein [Bacteroidales bacterium]